MPEPFTVLAKDLKEQEGLLRLAGAFGWRYHRKEPIEATLARSGQYPLKYFYAEGDPAGPLVIRGTTLDDIEPTYVFAEDKPRITRALREASLAVSGEGAARGQ